ncbi:MAG: hypothetical protein GQ582_02410, partial [Methyloprofundus sp.]|nr:hypothetical protein [Methyloprofundus sp.]
MYGKIYQNQIHTSVKTIFKHQKNTMTPLSDKALYSAITYSRSLTETEGQTILTDFHIEHPALSGTIFSIFPAILHEKNRDMGAYFMDLCFDAICVYSHAFGKAKPQTKDW